MTDGKKIDPDPGPVDIKVQALRVIQPLGELFLASLPHAVLTRIADFDVRRKIQEERDVEKYLGIQRPLNDQRVKELKKYVKFVDATFPTAVILAVDDDYATYDDKTYTLEIRNYIVGEQPTRNIRYIARVIDGQHRIAGLYGFPEKSRFDVPVVFLLGTDIAEQANVFSTVNLEQSKVRKSLAYDLFALAQTRSPQRVCHQIAVTFDADPESPFFKRIKRLGLATPGRYRETITQATFVEGLLKLITRDPKSDRDLLLRGKELAKPTTTELKRQVFRALFVESRDIDIGQSVHAFFLAVKDRWPDAWNDFGEGAVLNKTNGFRALMRLLRALHRQHYGALDVIEYETVRGILQLSQLQDADFTVEAYAPGSTGEGDLFRDLADSCGLPHE